MDIDLETEFQNLIKVEETRIGDEPSGDPNVKSELPLLIAESEVSGCELCKKLARFLVKLKKRFDNMEKVTDQIKQVAEKRDHMNIQLKQGIKKRDQMILQLTDERLASSKQIMTLNEELIKKDKSLKFQTDQLNNIRAEISRVNQKSLYNKFQNSRATYSKSDDVAVIEIKANNSRILTNGLSSPAPMLYDKQPLEITVDDSGDEGFERSTSSEEYQQEERFSCELCDSIFQSARSLSSHKGHCQRKIRAKSNVSRGSVPLKSNDKSPPQSRTTQQPAPQSNALQCPICLKIFRRACGLGSHRRIHVSQQNFIGNEGLVRKEGKGSLPARNASKLSVSLPY